MKSQICKRKVGANVSDVLSELALTEELEKKFLHPGPGYGGSCFPKDTLALVKTARDSKAPLGLIEHVVKSNNERKKYAYKRVLNAVGKTKKKKK